MDDVVAGVDRVVRLQLADGVPDAARSLEGTPGRLVRGDDRHEHLTGVRVVGEPAGHRRGDHGRAQTAAAGVRFAEEPESLAELSAGCPVPPGARSIDYLVGAPADRGRGLGTAMIAAAVARGFADHPDAADVLVPVVRANEASWRTLLRAGATWYAEGELEPDNPVDSRDHVVLRFTRPVDPELGT